MPLTLSTDVMLRARYSQGAGIFRIIPALVVRPAETTDLAEAIELARRDHLTITPRGAGSAMDGSNVGAGMLLDLTAFDADRCGIDAADRSVTVSPATVLAQLNNAAAAQGLRFPVDPSSANFATLGGMISTNASGPRSVRTGSVRRWVQRVELMTSDGPLGVSRDAEPDHQHPVLQRWHRDVAPLLECHAKAIRDRFPRVRKNSAGYGLDHYLRSGNLIDVIIGSEGTLGVIVGAALELEPIPLARASVRVAFHDRADLARLIEAIRTQDPATLEMLDRSFLQVIATRPTEAIDASILRDAAGLLLADFEGDSADAMIRANAAANLVRRYSLDVQVATEASQIDELWSVRHGASPVLAGLSDGRRSLQVIEDGCVPVDRLAKYLDAVDAAAREQRIDAVMFGHAGDGHVHVNLLPNLRDHDWKQRVRAIYDSVSDTVLRLGGTPSGEHGAGRLRAGLLPRLYGPEVMECFRAVKLAFDPDGIFNPGVILGDGTDPLSDLKVGDDAVSLPDGIAEYLQRIEAEAGWGASRWT